MVDFNYKKEYDVNDLCGIVKILRSENGCPWDHEQTHETLRRAMLEEAYEVVEAIDEGSSEHLKEELGDVLLQVVFHADIEDDAGRFTINDVADGTVKKLILRHPHVFGDTKVADSDEVLSNWEEIKRVEKHQDTVKSSLDAVAKSLPSLWRAEKLQKKASKFSKYSFSLDDAAASIEECVSKLKAGNKDAVGTLLFAAVAAARALDVDPEKALADECAAFTEKFN